jgi:hypothetical protein
VLRSCRPGESDASGFTAGSDIEILTCSQARSGIRVTTNNEAYIGAVDKH